MFHDQNEDSNLDGHGCDKYIEHSVGVVILDLINDQKADSDLPDHVHSFENDLNLNVVV